mmetsp:Transcript_5993/g.10890  ORF Transcript_5993/g.10890 Transcript_5993/m.10890 type:complete len:214 (+) Transcript_5993:353-994(+)
MLSPVRKCLNDMAQRAEGGVNLLCLLQHATNRTALANLLRSSEINQCQLALSNSRRLLLSQHQGKNCMRARRMLIQARVGSHSEPQPKPQNLHGFRGGVDLFVSQTFHATGPLLQMRALGLRIQKIADSFKIDLKKAALQRRALALPRMMEDLFDSPGDQACKVWMTSTVRSEHAKGLARPGRSICEDRAVISGQHVLYKRVANVLVKFLLVC